MTEQKTPQITYPCPWQFKLIGMNQDAIKLAIGEIIGDHDHRVAPSKVSSSDKYISLNVELEVHSEEHRDTFFFQLRDHVDIKFVI